MLFGCLESNRLNLAPRTFLPFALGSHGNEVKTRIHLLFFFVCFVLFLFFFFVFFGGGGHSFFKSKEMTGEVYHSFQITAVSQTGLFLRGSRRISGLKSSSNLLADWNCRLGKINCCYARLLVGF